MLNTFDPVCFKKFTREADWREHQSVCGFFQFASILLFFNPEQMRKHYQRHNTKILIWATEQFQSKRRTSLHMIKIDNTAESKNQLNQKHLLLGNKHQTSLNPAKVQFMVSAFGLDAKQLKNSIYAKMYKCIRHLQIYAHWEKFFYTTQLIITISLNQIWEDEKKTHRIMEG